MKKIFAVLAVLCLIMPWAGCSRYSEGTEADLSDEPEPPNMLLTCTAGNETRSETVYHSTFVWETDNEDGTGSRREVFGEHLHPLAKLAAPMNAVMTLKRADINEKIGISFPVSPDSFAVRRWEDSCIGNADKYRHQWSPVEVNENTISAPNDGKGYVYEVTAYWPEGHANYTFYLK